jgi:hypothetical protein
VADPALATPVVIVPPSSRDRGIVTLAATGPTSKDVAERTFLSVRTVNSHSRRCTQDSGSVVDASSPARSRRPTQSGRDAQPNQPEITIGTGPYHGGQGQTAT